MIEENWIRLIHPGFRIRLENIEYTASELISMIQNLCSNILAIDPQPQGKKYYIDIKDRLTFVLLFFALMQLGVKPVLVPVEIKPEDYMNTEVILISDNKKVDGSLSVSQDGSIVKIGEPVLNIPTDRGTDSFYLFTSGSTGKPRLIGKSYNHIKTEIVELNKLFERKAHESFYFTPPLYHIYGILFGLFLPAFFGKCLYLDYHFTPESISSFVKEKQVDFFISIPSYYRMFVALDLIADFKSARILTSSSAPLDTQVSADFFQKGLPVTEIYGSTETGGIARRVSAVNPEWELFSYVKVLNREESLDLNELIIDSPAISVPYDRQSGYHTGDLVMMKPDNCFILSGRNTRFVKISGKRLDLKYVENKISVYWSERFHQAVDENRLLVLEKNEILYVFIDAPIPVTVKEIINDLRHHLPGYAVPRYWFTSVIKRNPMGKLDKKYFDSFIENLQINS